MGRESPKKYGVDLSSIGIIFMLSFVKIYKLIILRTARQTDIHTHSHTHTHSYSMISYFSSNLRRQFS
jgi:hypothetical protein